MTPRISLAGALAALCLLLLAPWPALAADPTSISAITVTTNGQGQQEYSVSLQILLIMTALSFIPAFVMLMTSFTRIIIVFSILRQALGLQSTPSNQVLVGLALFLTMFVMAPVFDKINSQALQPYLNEQIPAQEALQKAEVPLKAQTRTSDLELFVRLSKRTDIGSPEATPLTILVPAFVTSELKTAFQIGFMIFIPFLIIDLVVSSVLMAMGMMMLSPLIISLPFKIMLFVLVDGWALIIGTLAGSFGTV
ncbi:flagellar type III secretion system pore protein FliP [Pseudomonas aeruginosa]|uniref:flagellar type III secretion system pore protein FliP n=1 Tax=Pseudomonas aeruginosa TaxID=287 RepID=UPI003D9C13CD